MCPSQEALFTYGSVGDDLTPIDMYLQDIEGFRPDGMARMGVLMFGVK